MKSTIFSAIFILILSGPSAAQQLPEHTDPTEVSPEKYTVLLENEHVRIVEYVIKPGEKDAWHTHPPKASYIGSGGKLRITPEGADSFVVQEDSGNATWMGALGRHFGETSVQHRCVLCWSKSSQLSDAPSKTLTNGPVGFECLTNSRRCYSGGSPGAGIRRNSDRIGAGHRWGDRGTWVQSPGAAR